MRFLLFALFVVCFASRAPLRDSSRALAGHRHRGCQATPKTCEQQLRELGIPIATPDDEWWTAIFMIAFPQYNRRPPPYSITPRNSEEVRLAMECLHREGTRVAVKGGGHNYAGFSAAPLGGVQLNLKRNMRHIEDVSESWNGPAIRVEGGAVFEDVYLFLNDTANGLVGNLLSGGFCPSVGVSGFHLAGGLGALSQEFGLGVDNILQVTMVLANGSSVVNASATENSDLFWALRGGGGGSLGVATHFVLRLHPESDLFGAENPMYSYAEFCLPSSDPDAIKAELRQFASRYDRIPPWLTISWRLLKNDGAYGLCYLLYSLRSWTETEPVLAEIITLPSRSSILLGTYPLGNNDADLGDNELARNFVKNFTNFLEMELANAAFKGYEEHFTWPIINQCCVIKGLNASDDLIDRIVAHWTIMPDGRGDGQDCYIQGMVLGSGKVATIPPSETAFFWRTYAYASDTECRYRNEQEQEIANAFTRGYREAVGPDCAGAFLNFPSVGISDYAAEYWGENLPRLSDVVSQWNPRGPSNTMRFDQEIP